MGRFNKSGSLSKKISYGSNNNIKILLNFKKIIINSFQQIQTHILKITINNISNYNAFLYCSVFYAWARVTSSIAVWMILRSNCISGKQNLTTYYQKWKVLRRNEKDWESKWKSEKEKRCLIEMERERVKLNNVALDVLFKMKSNSGEG